jgi:hypothetical protein
LQLVALSTECHDVDRCRLSRTDEQPAVGNKNGPQGDRIDDRVDARRRISFNLQRGVTETNAREAKWRAPGVLCVPFGIGFNNPTSRRRDADHSETQRLGSLHLEHKRGLLRKETRRAVVPHHVNAHVPDLATNHAKKTRSKPAAKTIP